MCGSDSDFKNCNRHSPSDSFPWLQILIKKEGLSPAALPLCQWAVGRAQRPWEQRTNFFSSIMCKALFLPRSPHKQLRSMVQALPNQPQVRIQRSQTLSSSN